MWKKGRFVPLLAAVFVFLFLLFSCWLTLGAAVHRPKGTGFWVVADVVLAAITACCIAAAFRRRVTLTSNDLVVRTLFRTRVLPLGDITELRIARHRSRARFRSTRVRTDTYDHSPNEFPLLKFVRFLLRRLHPGQVRIETSRDGRTCKTKSFGLRPWEAMQEIAKAAKAAGSPIDLHATGQGPAGIEWMSERVRDARDRM